jgi:hypothetical protein
MAMVTATSMALVTAMAVEKTMAKVNSGRDGNGRGWQ